jgi:hypothetical protein
MSFQTISSDLYDTISHPATIVSIMGSFLKDSKAQAIALLQKNGVAINSLATGKQVRMAWAKAIKDSQTFRDDAAAALTHYVTVVKAKVSPGASNFVNGTTYDFINQGGYYNDINDISFINPFSSSVAVDQSVVNAGAAATAAAPAASTPAPATPADSSSSSGSFWDSLGSIFTPKVIQAGITTGLNAYSTSLTAKANKSSEQNALLLAQTQLAQAQVKAAAPTTGLSTGWKIAIGVTGALVLITVVAVFVHKKKY